MIHEALGYIRRELRDRLPVADAEVMIESARVLASQNNAQGAYITLVNVEDPVAGVRGRPLDGPGYAEFVAGAEVLAHESAVTDDEGRCVVALDPAAWSWGVLHVRHPEYIYHQQWVSLGRHEEVTLRLARGALVQVGQLGRVHVLVQGDFDHRGTPLRN